MTIKLKLFMLALTIGIIMLGAWSMLSNSLIIGTLVGGMSFASFLFGSAATTYISK